MRGERVEKVTAKKRAVTYNDFNEVVEDWDSNDISLYAEFWGRHGKEGEQNGQVLVVQDTRCKVRYNARFDTRISPDAEADNRIVRNNITYDITSILNEDRGKTQLLMLERRS